MFIQILFLPKLALEHLNLVSELIVFKLVFVGLTTDLIVTLISEFLKLTLFAVLKMADHITGLLELQTKVFDENVLIVLEFVAV